MTFAIFTTGGKQYRVQKGDVILVEKLAAEKNIEFDNILAVGDKIGTPTVKGAKIKADIVEQTRGDKVLIFKKNRRHNYRRTNGHRQDLTVLKITDIIG